MSFSDREKQLIRAAFSWGQITQKEGYTLSDLEIEKSVLFRRLLAGRPALAYPPPLRHGFPWYEAIEGNGEHLVSASEASAECSIIAPGSRPGDTCILIDGAFWRVVETVRDREEFIVEWGQYPVQWRLRKHWEVNYEMTQQLHSFRKDNPNEEIQFDNRSGQREYSEFRIDNDQTVWLSEWRLTRLGLPGWVWVGTPLEGVPENGELLTPLFWDHLGPLIIGESDKKRGAGWLRIECAGQESRFVKLGDKFEYQSLVLAAMTGYETLLQDIQGENLEVMDWSNGGPLRHYLVPANLAPLEEFKPGDRGYDLVPDNAYTN